MLRFTVLSLALIGSLGCGGDDATDGGADGGADGETGSDAGDSLDASGEDGAHVDGGVDTGTPGDDAGIDSGSPGPWLTIAWAAAATPWSSEDCAAPTASTTAAGHDGTGGVILACIADASVRAQRVLADGSIGWAAPTEVLTGAPGLPLSLREDDSLGPLVACTVDGEARIQRLALDGTIGGTTAGAPTAFTQGWLLPDALDGGWLLGYPGASGEVLAALRLDASPSVVAGPHAIADAPASYVSGIASQDTANGLYVLYQRGPADWLLTHLQEDGTRWASPIVLTSSGSSSRIRLRGDTTGVWATWETEPSIGDRRAWAARFLRDGSAVGSPIELGDMDNYEMTSDASGAAWVFRQRSPSSVVTTTVDVLRADGTLASSTAWPEAAAGVVIDAAVDASGDIIALVAPWESGLSGALYAQRVAPDGSPRIDGLGVALHAPATGAPRVAFGRGESLVPLTTGAFGVVYFTDEYVQHVQRLDVVP
jgi:hypothetical protein